VLVAIIKDKDRIKKGEDGRMEKRKQPSGIKLSLVKKLLTSL